MPKSAELPKYRRARRDDIKIRMMKLLSTSREEQACSPEYFLEVYRKAKAMAELQQATEACFGCGALTKFECWDLKCNYWGFMEETVRTCQRIDARVAAKKKAQ